MNKKLVNQLNQLLSDEDLTDEKLREASECLLPNLADVLNRDMRLDDSIEQIVIDNIASQAMQGILASQVHFRGNGATNAEKEAIEIAKESYIIAKAMFKVRKEVNNG